MSSDCRELISKDTECHTSAILSHFHQESCGRMKPASPCSCCFNCIKSHSDNGCEGCKRFLSRYFPVVRRVKMIKSVASELASALSELFEILSMKCIKVETSLEVSCSDFIKDLMKHTVRKINLKLFIISVLIS